MSVTDAKWSAQSKLQPGESDTLSFSVGGSKEEGSVYTQDVYVARLTVTITASKAFVDYFANDLPNLVVGGYNSSSYWTGQGTFAFTKASDTTLVASKTLPFNLSDGAHPTSVKFTMPTDKTEFLSVAESAYSASISVEEDPTYVHAYVRGSFNNWGVDDAWRMVPNLGKDDKFEWMHTLSASHTVANASELKCYKYIDGTNDLWAGNYGDNLKVSGDWTSGAIYWNGEKDSLVSHS